jgi:hypothetical protein
MRKTFSNLFTFHRFEPRGPQFSVGETATLVVCSFRFFDRIVLLHDTYRSR